MIKMICKVCSHEWTPQEANLRQNTEICSRICADEHWDATDDPTYFCFVCGDGERSSHCEQCGFGERH